MRLRFQAAGEWAKGILHIVLLRIASLLVPSRQRADWWREWRGELWHVSQSRLAAKTQHSGEVTAFCMGAFPDALCLRRSGKQGLPFVFKMQGTPAECVLILLALLATSYAGALLLPGVRAERSLWRRTANPGLVAIYRQGSSYDAHPSISATEFRDWAGRQQRYFDGLAFYTVATEPLTQTSPERDAKSQMHWQVGRATSNLFMLMGLPVELADSSGLAGRALPAVVLSESVWKRQFGADPHVAGTVLRLGHEEVEIAGVAPDGSLGLPGRVDAWRLAPDAAQGPRGPGYVIAHLSPAGAAEMWNQCVRIEVNGLDSDDDDLLAVSMNEWKPAPATLYRFALFLALLALPAITAVSLGEYSLNPPQTSWLEKTQRWSFLGAKVALLLPIVYFVSLDLAYGCTSLAHEPQKYLQLITAFGVSLFGMSWILKDQRQRCPVCLCRVTHPAQVGQASRTFLDWNGTEMMCMGGHTLLHVPSLPTSWFSSQRWLYLDTSWDFLFAGSTQPLP